MGDEKKEGWLKILPATTVIIAVCATLSTFKGGGYSTKSMLNQTKASDQWALYEAKSIKAYLCEMQKENLELTLKGLEGKDASYAADLSARITSYEDKIKKLGKDKDDITKVAKDFEGGQLEMKQHADLFGIAVIFLQISILLSSIGALVKRKILWLLSLVVGLLGIYYFADGFLLFF